MRIYRLGNIEEKEKLLKALGVESTGISIMSKKMELFYFYISNLKTPAVNILKQDALSIGAELAVPSGVITCEKDKFDCILIGNKKQIEILSKKELTQPFGLKQLAKELYVFLESRKFPTQIMGIINANDDSFYAKSRFQADAAIIQIEKMIVDGADIIDIGAVSSRPGSEPANEHIELDHIRPICDVISREKLYEKVKFSIDSYTPSVVEYALKNGFTIINDITGASDKKIIHLAVKYNAKLCIMHMQGKPATMQSSPSYNNVILEIDEFFEERIKKCEALGLRKESIILDTGIGFGKKLAHNIELVKNLRHFERFGCEILLGASMKSMIDDIVSTPIDDRLAGTLAIHLKAIANGADIIRCHDVRSHKQAITIAKHIN
ncbi:MAG: dihydropteroate synthase [Sulfurovum sp.]|nr:dihydropteroate synthase [Sulfurovum sp.]